MGISFVEKLRPRSDRLPFSPELKKKVSRMPVDMNAMGGLRLARMRQKQAT